MSTFGILAFIVMPVLGGLIAWAGDVIGYRLGKSRRSLFGLRPRSTARLVGVAVGVALPLLGLLTALAGSSDARDALLHIDDLRRTEKQLQDNNAKLQSQIARASALARESEDKARQYGRRLQRVSEDLSRAGLRLEAANAQVRATSRDVADLRADKQALSRAQALLQQRVGMLRNRSKELGNRVGGLSKTLASTQQTLEGITTRLTLTRAELTQKEQELSRRLKAGTSPIVFESGHELVRAIVETGDTVEETEDKLSKLLMLASVAAQGRGAEIGPNTLAIRLDGPRPFPDHPGAAPASERDILAAFARDKQQQGKRKWVVMVRVLRRMYEEEDGQASVELYALPYDLAFHKDEVICAVTIDGSQGRAEVFNQLWNLVTKLVRREAQERKLLRDPDSGQYGSLPTSELLTALDSICAARGPVHVEVKAEQDTHIGDPLAIRIEVNSGEGVAAGGDRAGRRPRA